MFQSYCDLKPCWIKCNLRKPRRMSWGSPQCLHLPHVEHTGKVLAGSRTAWRWEGMGCDGLMQVTADHCSSSNPANGNVWSCTVCLYLLLLRSQRQEGSKPTQTPSSRNEVYVNESLLWPGSGHELAIAVMVSESACRLLQANIIFSPCSELKGALWELCGLTGCRCPCPCMLQGQTSSTVPTPIWIVPSSRKVRLAPSVSVRVDKLRVSWPADSRAAALQCQDISEGEAGGHCGGFHDEGDTGRASENPARMKKLTS